MYMCSSTFHATTELPTARCFQPNYSLYLLLPQIDLCREDTFQILSLCTEFGLPVLKTYCIEHLGSTLTVDSVCDTLVGAHTSLETNQGDRTLQEIVQKCLKFVEGNTRAVFQSKGFLHLSKGVVITLVSRNEVHVQCQEFSSNGSIWIMFVYFD